MVIETLIDMFDFGWIWMVFWFSLAPLKTTKHIPKEALKSSSKEKEKKRKKARIIPKKLSELEKGL